MSNIKWSQFPSETPISSDTVVGLHVGENARFTVANLVVAVRQGLVNFFVPNSNVGVANGVAGLGSNGKVPAAQLPTIPDEASEIGYNNTSSRLTATDVQAALDEVVSNVGDKQDEITASGILVGDGSGGVSAAVAGTDYQEPLTFDNAPTNNSDNPVTSGGVYTAIRERPRVADLLFNQAETVIGGKTITLSENVADYSYLAILMLTESALDYNHRVTIVVPTISLGFNSWFPVIADNVNGAVRITSVSGQPKQLAFASPTLSSLWVQRVDGYR